MNAELFARSPDHIRLLLALLEDEPVGTSDFYCRWGTPRCSAARWRTVCGHDAVGVPCSALPTSRQRTAPHHLLSTAL